MSSEVNIDLQGALRLILFVALAGSGGSQAGRGIRINALVPEILFHGHETVAVVVHGQEYINGLARLAPFGQADLSVIIGIAFAEKVVDALRQVAVAIDGRTAFLFFLRNRPIRALRGRSAGSALELHARLVIGPVFVYVDKTVPVRIPLLALGLQILGPLFGVEQAVTLGV